MPQRGSAKKTLFRSTGTHGDISGEASSETSDTSGSSADTVLLESNDEDNSSAGMFLKLEKVKVCCTGFCTSMKKHLNL